MPEIRLRPRVEIHHNVSYEPRDVNVRALLRLGIFIIISAVIIHAGGWMLFEYLSRSGPHERRPAMLFPQGGPQAPPEPRLQLAPETDLKQKQAAANELLNSYGWVDRQSGVVRIPIEQAMKMVAEKGWPSPTPGSATRPRANESSGIGR